MSDIYIYIYTYIKRKDKSDVYWKYTFLASLLIFSYISKFESHTNACPTCAVKEILKLCPARLLVTLYKIPSFESVDDFLQKVATVRGKLKKGGIVDVDAAARIVLHDWNGGMCL